MKRKLGAVSAVAVAISGVLIAGLSFSSPAKANGEGEAVSLAAPILMQPQASADFVESLAPGYQTTRLWMGLGEYMSWWEDAPTTAVKAYNGGEAVLYEATRIVSSKDSSAVYWYADVPVGLDSYQFVRLDKTYPQSIWNSSVATTIGETYMINVVSAPVDASGDYSITKSAISESAADGAIAARILEGYTTCLSSEINGYNAQPGLQENLISRLDEASYGDFESEAISDYSYGVYDSDGGEYQSDHPRSATTTGAEKWAQMSAMYVASSLAIGPRGDGVSDGMATIGAVGILLGFAFVDFLLYRREKLAA
ncbi:MAG: hypothetical protein LKG11_03205 [Bacilli bacterium]|jgi:hypothetical protein|nr:hypothetical protein [Bacilli bacterium]